MRELIAGRYQGRPDLTLPLGYRRCRKCDTRKPIKGGRMVRGQRLACADCRGNHHLAEKMRADALKVENQKLRERLASMERSGWGGGLPYFGIRQRKSRRR